jgi:hypothetical protein
MKSNDGVMNFRGNDYYTVARRVADFRAAHPISAGWGIVTEPAVIDEKIVRFKATITDPEGRIVATGYAEETRTSRGVNATSALENCETSSIGRALAAAGYVAGGQYASADEIIQATSRPTPPPSPTVAFHSCGAPIPLEVFEGKHPSWAGEQKAFCAALADSRMGIRYEDLAAFLEAMGLARPSQISRPDRQELYRWLRRDGLDVIAAHMDSE